MKVDRPLDVQAASSRFSCLLHEADRRQTQPSPTQQITTPTSRFSVPPFLSRPMADSTLRLSFLSQPIHHCLSFSRSPRSSCSSSRSRLDTRRFSVAFPAFLLARSSRKTDTAVPCTADRRHLGAHSFTTVSFSFAPSTNESASLGEADKLLPFASLPLFGHTFSADWAGPIVRRVEGRRGSSRTPPPHEQ